MSSAEASGSALAEELPARGPWLRVLAEGSTASYRHATEFPLGRAQSRPSRPGRNLRPYKRSCRHRDSLDNKSYPPNVCAGGRVRRMAPSELLLMGTACWKGSRTSWVEQDFRKKARRTACSILPSGLLPAAQHAGSWSLTPRLPKRDATLSRTPPFAENDACRNSTC